MAVSITSYNIQSCHISHKCYILKFSCGFCRTNINCFHKNISWSKFEGVVLSLWWRDLILCIVWTCYTYWVILKLDTKSEVQGQQFELKVSQEKYHNLLRFGARTNRLQTLHFFNYTPRNRVEFFRFRRKYYLHFPSKKIKWTPKTKVVCSS